MPILFLFILSFSIKAQTITFNKDFLFGVSNASAQVEDKLNDPWMKFGKEKGSAFNNIIKPADKIKFWTEPEREIEWAKKLGVNVFRMSVDWQRLVPTLPKESGKVQNLDAIKRYREIFNLIKKNNMLPMVTLFHHSLPEWAIKIGGWKNKKVKKYFIDFSLDVLSYFKQDIIWWNTFNEPNVYAMFSYVAGIWPPGIEDKLGVLNLPFYKGGFFKAMDNMTESHNEIYKKAKKINSKFKIGIAHNTAYYKKSSPFSGYFVNWSWENMNYLFPDKTYKHLDFMGINYYGAEHMVIGGIEFSKKAEYNDAGRAFYPDGLALILEDFYKRYKLPIMITENGTADADDFHRESYIIEHLKALKYVMKKGVPVLGYIQWSLTDNFEWSDGYCPKFGLIEIDRKNNLKRLPRQSFYLFQKIIEERSISKTMQEKAWKKVKNMAGKKRKTCRDKNAKDSLDNPRYEIYKSIDWRFKI